MTDHRTRPALQLAADVFQIEEALVFEGRPVGMVITGEWAGAVCELMLGLTALAPRDFCRIILGVRFDPESGLHVTRVSEPDDPRDDAGVIERHFGKPVDALVGIASVTIGRALTEAASIRAERILGEMPTAPELRPSWETLH